MKFCGECFNLLYASEDEATSRLKFICLTCRYSEFAEEDGASIIKSHCIFKHQVNKEVAATPASLAHQQPGDDKQRSVLMDDGAISSILGYTKKQLADFRHDPALPRAQTYCNNCGGSIAVWIQTDLPDKQLLTFVCCNPEQPQCTNHWTESGVDAQ